MTNLPPLALALAHAATAWAPVNIALIKHWGYYSTDQGQRTDLPARPSLSLTLEHGSTTTVTWRDQPDHRILLNGEVLTTSDGEKATASYAFLEAVRKAGGLGSLHASVQAVSEVPLSAGFASSAAGGAALTVAALEAAGIDTAGTIDLGDRGDRGDRGDLGDRGDRGDRGDLGDRLDWCRRLGSVSALRSLRGGVVRLDVDHEAATLALGGVETDLDLVVLGCLVQGEKKAVSSSAGHGQATTSPYWTQFAHDAQGRLNQLVDGLVAGDLAQVGALAEADALAMHAVMLTSQPSIVYATDATWRVWHQVVSWRGEDGPSLQGYCTLDAGPNPHILCTRTDADELARRLLELPDVQRVFRSGVAGSGARRITTPDTTAPTQLAW